MLVEAVVFKLNDTNYCLDIQNVKEIINYPKNITVLPNVDSSINGLINLRGEVVPVINLKKYFKINEEAKEEDMVIIVKLSDNRMIGFVVDFVLAIEKLEVDNFLLPNTINSSLQPGFIERYIKIDENTMYVLLNIDNVFSKELIMNL